MRQFGTCLRAAGAAWHKDNAVRMSASLSYYTLLSLAPMLLLTVSVAGLFHGGDVARAQIASATTSRFGEEAGAVIEAIVTSTPDPEDNFIGALIGLFVIVFGASGLFLELQSAMNTIWEVTPRVGRGVWGLIRDRFMCFAMVASVAVLLFVLLAIGVLLALLGTRIGTLPGGVVLWQVVDLCLSVVAVTLLFALSYKAIPDVIIPLSEVWPGALLTAAMFMLSEVAFGLYLQFSQVPKPQGAAGSIVVLVTWVYYTSQILLFGAEFTKVRAASRGVRITPRPHATWIRSTHAGVAVPP